jgi:hypothetical protein
MAILPLFAFLGCWAALYVRDFDWRASFIAGSVIWGLWVALTTEALGSVTRLSRGNIAVSWLLAAAIAWVCAFRSTKRIPAGVFPRQGAAFKLSVVEWISLAAIGAVLLLTGIVAIVGAPNSWDAMQYSMPRVIMYLENHSVRMYPTVDYQQLTMSPWADYAMLHIIALRGSDRLADLVAWFSFLGSVIGVSLIARELRAGRAAQILAALFCATIPSAILFASSTKPDETVGFWIVASVYLLLRWRSTPHWTIAFLAASAIGLTVMTKGTAYVLLPAILAAVFWMWPADLKKKFLPWIPAAGAVILLLNGPLYTRNMRLSGSPLGFASPDGDADTLGQRRFSNATHKPQDIAANVLRNAALHLGAPGEKINALTERTFRRLIRSLGSDPDDPRMIEGGNSGGTIPFGITRMSLTETRAGNPLLLFLFLGALLLIGRLRLPLRRDMAILAIGLVGGFILFCAGIRWQPWNGRFHLPLFMVAAAVAAITLSECCSKWIVATAAGLAIIGAVPFALLNSQRPLVQIKGAHRKEPVPSILRMERDRIYFSDQHLYLADSFAAAAGFVKASGCRNVGLDASVLHYDYPMLALLRAGVGGPTVRYVGVVNRTGAFATGAGAPCAVVCLGCSLIHQKWKEYGGPSVDSASFDRVEVFVSSKPHVSPTATSAGGPGLSERCASFPEQNAEKTLGSPLRELARDNSCEYDGPTGSLLIKELPTGASVPQFDDLASEGMGSFPVGTPRYAAVVVYDGGWTDRPVMMYVSKDNRLFGINLDRPDNAVSTNDFLQLAEDLRTTSARTGSKFH